MERMHYNHAKLKRHQNPQREKDTFYYLYTFKKLTKFLIF